MHQSTFALKSAPAPSARRTPTTVQEAYSFVCLQCGHGWERSYVIEHHDHGRSGEQVVYTVDGRRVPSPLTRPSCPGCEHGVVRILRSGRVMGAQSAERSAVLHAPWQENLLKTLFPSGL